MNASKKEVIRKLQKLGQRLDLVLDRQRPAKDNTFVAIKAIVQNKWKTGRLGRSLATTSSKENITRTIVVQSKSGKPAKVKLVSGPTSFGSPPLFIALHPTSSSLAKEISEHPLKAEQGTPKTASGTGQKPRRGVQKEQGARGHTKIRARRRALMDIRKKLRKKSAPNAP
jgi:hypothetical protein